MDDDEPIDVLVDADDDTERRLGRFPNPPLEQCPIVPLGFDGGRVIFAMPEGEIRIEAANKLPGMLKTDIFACVPGQSFLTHWRDSADKFQRDLATIWFVRKCREAGKWDTRRVQRLMGVWPGEPGEVVLHRGGHIEKWRPTGKPAVLSIAQALAERSGPLYVLRPPAPRPAGKAASVADGEWARAHMNAWRFEALGDEGLTGADVVMGYVGLALLGAVAPFRAHVMANALPGSGKTTFLEFVHALLSALCGEVINSFTDAGLRAEISGYARPLIVDEAESSAGDMGPGPVETVLAYIRLMSTGAGANRRQVDTHGGAGQGAQTAVGAVLMAAVNTPKLESALATRVAEIRLMPLDAPDDPDGPERLRLTDAQLSEAASRARDLAPAILARALRSAGRYREDLAAIKAALVDSGRSPRTADLIASLAAGRLLLMADKSLDAEAAAEEARAWAPLLDAREKAENVSNPGADAFAWLMSADSGVVRHGSRVPIGRLIKESIAAKVERIDHRDVLGQIGLRIYEGMGPKGHEGPWLQVANHHPSLERIFARTQWRDHRKALEYLDLIHPDTPSWPTQPLNFGLGVKSRALALPLTPWEEKPFRDVPEARSSDDVDF